jgi:hypothetical protein
MADAFYVSDGDRFESTAWTRGPWGPDSQHAGPPSALIARAIERLDAGSEMQVARFTAEILRPIPVTTLTVDARVVRPGRKVQYVEATLSDEHGEVIRAHAWRIRHGEAASVPPTEQEPLPHPVPAEIPVFEPPPFYDGSSYFTGMEWRLAEGAFFEPGPAAAWMRMRHPLVEGEPIAPLARVLVAADSGNGISMELPIGQYVFINVDLSVHLYRMPVGEWVCLDARTRIDGRGIGLAESRLWDETGLLGRGNQSLYVAPA